MSIWFFDVKFLSVNWLDNFLFLIVKFSFQSRTHLLTQQDFVHESIFFSLIFDDVFFLFFHEIFLSVFFCFEWKSLLFCWLMNETKNKLKTKQKFPTRLALDNTTESVELELSANVPSPQNLLFDASTSLAANDLHGIASSFGANNTTGSSYESPSIVSSSSGQQQQATGGGKKESHLFGWFASSTSTSTSSAVQNMSVTSTSSSATTASPPTIANRSNVNDLTPTNGQDGTSSPSTKISSKLSYGEMFKFNKNGNKATALDQHAVEQPPPGASKEQQKSSRRTTSLLNLFMSNSQGNQNNSHLHLKILQNKLA